MNTPKYLTVLLLIALISLSCTKSVDKPKLSISDYNLQATTSKGVVEKILNESDYKKMHEIALAVESSRAVHCTAISDECNVLGQILNKIVNSTNEGPPKEADNIAIYKLVNQLGEEYKIGEEKLAAQWKEYINAHASESDSK